MLQQAPKSQKIEEVPEELERFRFHSGRLVSRCRKKQVSASGSISLNPHLLRHFLLVFCMAQSFQFERFSSNLSYYTDKLMFWLKTGEQCGGCSLVVLDKSTLFALFEALIPQRKEFRAALNLSLTSL